MPLTRKSTGFPPTAVRPRAAAVTCALAALLCASEARAQPQHDVRAFVSTAGIDFLEAQIPSYVPRELYPPDFAKGVGCADLELSNIYAGLQVDYVDISSPQPGRLRVELQVGANAQADLRADDIYVCVGSETCEAELILDRLYAAVEYDLLVENGKIYVYQGDVDIDLNGNDVDVNFIGCGIAGSALNTAIDFSKGWLLDLMDDKIDEVARSKMAQAVADMVSGLGPIGFQGNLGGVADFSFVLDSLTIDPDGLAVGVQADIFNQYAAAECIREYDPGEPADVPGDRPILAYTSSAHVGAAINFGLLNDALYHVWRGGFLCLTDEYLYSFGVEIPYEMIGGLLPGFPVGTEFSAAAMLTAPPRIQGGPSADAEMTVVIEGIVVDLVGERPDGGSSSLHAEVDVEATAVVALDPKTNAITAALKGAVINRLVIENEPAATREGFDVARLMQLIHEHMLPEIIHEVGMMSLTGPVFSFADYAVVLRQLSTTSAYLQVGADLFRVPEGDDNAPDTQLLSYPRGWVSPKNAILTVTGQDAEIPSELLRYRFVVDDEDQGPSNVREFLVGEHGVSKEYKVRITSIDLSENEDQSPVIVDVRVDGVSPTLTLNGTRVRNSVGNTEFISWNMGDDLTDPAALVPRVEVFKLKDKSDALTAKHVETHELEPGVTEFELPIAEGGGVYRIEVHVVDEAGNDTASSLLLEVAGSGGCQLVGGEGGPAGPLAVLGLLALGLRRRRNEKSGAV